jgi:crossover junction endodeoxyribonuclease RuvC|tara:strand:- start:896 stop:1414 length:519 start_codon:yes stop_codon:yes gene_type:complete
VVVIGIDPGKDGAVVVVNGDYEVLAWWLTKDTCTVKVGKGSKREYFDVKMAQIIREAAEFKPGPILVCMEKQGARPGQGSVSMYSIGLGSGLWRGIVASQGLPLVNVHPRTWAKKILRDVPGQGKGRSILAAQSMFPTFDLTPGRKRKPHDGLADALCIALYGLSQMRGEQG